MTSRQSLITIINLIITPVKYSQGQPVDWLIDWSIGRLIGFNVIFHPAKKATPAKLTISDEKKNLIT